MSDTPRFGLPLVEGAQAQKHVTVNEALSRLDALASARVVSITENGPPASPGEGDVWAVADGAHSEWLGQEGTLACYLNGGWVFDAVPEGWQVWDQATGQRFTRLGSHWAATEADGTQAVSPGGALTQAGISEIDHTIGAGPTSTTAQVILDKAIVLGVSARVTDAITGATSWDLGVAGSPDRYGTGFGTGAGSFAEGVTGTPLAYYGGTPLVLTAQGGDFVGGTVRIAVHYLAISAPT